MGPLSVAVAYSRSISFVSILLTLVALVCTPALLDLLSQTLELDDGAMMPWSNIDQNILHPPSLSDIAKLPRFSLNSTWEEVVDLSLRSKLDTSQDTAWVTDWDDPHDIQYDAPAPPVLWSIIQPSPLNDDHLGGMIHLRAGGAWGDSAILLIVLTSPPASRSTALFATLWAARHVASRRAVWLPSDVVAVVIPADSAPNASQVVDAAIAAAGLSPTNVRCAYIVRDAVTERPPPRGLLRVSPAHRSPPPNSDYLAAVAVAARSARVSLAVTTVPGDALVHVAPPGVHSVVIEVSTPPSDPPAWRASVAEAILRTVRLATAPRERAHHASSDVLYLSSLMDAHLQVHHRASIVHGWPRVAAAVSAAVSAFRCVAARSALAAATRIYDAVGPAGEVQWATAVTAVLDAVVVSVSSVMAAHCTVCTEWPSAEPVAAAHTLCVLYGVPTDLPNMQVLPALSSSPRVASAAAPARAIPPLRVAPLLSLIVPTASAAAAGVSAAIKSAAIAASALRRRTWAVFFFSLISFTMAAIPSAACAAAMTCAPAEALALWLPLRCCCNAAISVLIASALQQRADS